MNKKQKIVLVVGAVLIFSALILWLAHGGDIFTKTQVLIEKQDELFGTTYNEWQDKIVIGLDYAGGFSAIVAVISAVLFFFFNMNKKQKIALVVGAVLIFFALIIFLFYGIGLDYAGSFSALVVVVTGVFLLLFRTKKLK